MTRYSMTYLVIISLLTEYWLDFSIVSIKVSLVFYIFIFFIYSKYTLAIIRAQSATLICYLFIVMGLVVNDLYVGADPVFIIKSIIFHLMSFITFIVLLFLFSKKESNFPKFLVIFALSLIIYKNGEYFPVMARVLEPPYFNSRLASLVLYLSVGLAFFITEKINFFFALLFLVLSFIYLFYMQARSSASIMLLIIMIWTYIYLFKPSFKNIFTAALLLLFSLFSIFHFYSEILNTIIIARIDTFSSLLYTIGNFPFGIGSGVVVDLEPSVNILSEFFGFSLSRVFSASNSDYSTAHSFLVGSLFKYGALSFVALLYLIINIFRLNMIMLAIKGRSDANKLLSVYILGSLSYTIIFSGYGQFLFQFPLVYAASIAMFKNLKEKHC